MTLTDEILDNISAYLMESFDSEANVIRAHMESTMRNITIETECERCGIVTEGFFDGVVPKRGTENIFKYIFFFIPRLVINLFRKLKAFFSGIKVKSLNDQVAETFENGVADRMKDSFINICNQINAVIPNGALTFSNGKFYYMSRIKVNLDSLSALYDDFKNTFSKYEEIFAGITEGEKVPKQVSEDIDAMVTAKARLELSELFSKQRETAISADNYVEGYSVLESTINTAADEVIGTMNRVLDKYQRIMAGKNFSAANKTLATKFSGYVESYYGEFLKFNGIVNVDLKAAYHCFMKKNQAVNEFIAKYRAETKDLETLNAFNKNLNDWGMK